MGVLRLHVISVLRRSHSAQDDNVVGGGALVLPLRHRRHWPFQVTVGKLQKGRPVRGGGVPAAVLAKGDVAVDQRRRWAGTQWCPGPSCPAACTPARRRRRPGTCLWHRPSHRLGRAAADEHRARGAQRDQLVGIHRQIVPVSGPAYLRKLPAIQWYSPAAATFSTSSPKLRRESLAPPSPEELT